MSKATAKGVKAPGAVIYTRVSTEEQAENGTSLAAQREAGLREAERLGLPVAAVCEDAGVSGTRYESRPGIMEALRLIEGGAASVLIAAKIDRVGRSARVVLDIVERIERAGGELSTGDARFDNGPAGRFLRTIYAGMAEMEREAIRERTMGGRRRLAQGGVQTAMKAPYGYHIPTRGDILRGLYPPDQFGKYVPDPDCAPVVQAVFRRYVAGETLHAIARALTAEGVPTPRTAPYWRINSLARILHNPAYKGAPVSGRVINYTDETRLKEYNPYTGQNMRTVRGMRAAPEEHWIILSSPPLVDEATWQTAQERLAVNKARRGGNRGRVMMLSGVLCCPACGSKMTPKTWQVGGVKRTHYLCVRYLKELDATGKRGCASTCYPLPDVEAAVILALSQAVRHPEAVAAALAVCREQATEPAPDPRKELAALDRALAELAQQEAATVQAQVAGIMAGASPDRYADAFAQLAARRKDLEDRRGALSRAIGGAARTDARTGPLRDEQQARDLLEKVGAVLTSPEVPGYEKRDLLVTVLDRVVCREGGADVVFLAGVLGGETVPCTEVMGTVRNGTCTFEAAVGT